MPSNVQEVAPCSICEREARVSTNFDDHANTVECERCGQYRISEDARYALATKTEYGFKRKARLATAVRRATQRGSPVEITVALLPLLADSVGLSVDPMEAADDVLLFLEPKTGSFGVHIPFDRDTLYPLFGLTTTESLRNVVDYMQKRGLVELRNQPSPGLAIQPEGYERLRQLRNTNRASLQAFVAMSFDPVLRPVYDIGISPAILSTGFKPIRVDDVVHNDRIDERIIAELRRSAFVVADFTDARTGVFFEAGFGLGLGLPVIWSCSAANFDALPKHFDTRQFNYIKWETPDDFRVRLKVRILATVSGAREATN